MQAVDQPQRHIAAQRIVALNQQGLCAVFCRCQRRGHSSGPAPNDSDIHLPIDRHLQDMLNHV